VLAREVLGVLEDLEDEAVDILVHRQIVVEGHEGLSADRGDESPL